MPLNHTMCITTCHYTILSCKLSWVLTMASSLLHFVLIFLSCSFLFLVSESQATFKPNKLVLPVSKDSATNLHVAAVLKRIPQTKEQLVVDLNGKFLWVNCEPNYLSATYQAPQCHSTHCSRANSPSCFTCPFKPRPGCHNNTCGLMLVNPVSQQSAMGELAQDVLTIQSTTGSHPGPMVRVPEFLFGCAPSRLLQKGLPKYAQGVAGLGHAPIALPTQLASYFGFSPNFALCLTSSTSTNNNGLIFFGEGPFYMLPGISIPGPVDYASLIISRQGEYYVQVSSIKINQKPIPLDTSWLTLSKVGFGGTKISTTNPYTVLEHSIYQSFTKIFTSQLLGIPQLAQPVAPFGVCYDARKIQSTPVGPKVPNIDFVFANQNVTWTIFGANSMVQARPGVLCLGFVDGGLRPRASIVIGTRQLEDNFVQFDLAKSRVGFSSSLLLHKTSCANFKFTISP